MDIKMHGVAFDAERVASRSLADWLEYAKERFLVDDPEQEAKLKEVHVEAVKKAGKPAKDGTKKP
jgi:hypothetical protein